MLTLEQLVHRLVELIPDEKVAEVKTLVVHRFPDDDCWLCLWQARKFIPKTADAEVVFVNAGERVPGSDGDESVLHFDTGGGEYDQHGRRLQRSCSAAILAEGLGHLEDPGLKPLLEMVTAVDNVEPLPSTSIHYAIEGYPRMLKNPDGTIDWQKVQNRVFELFEIVYTRETRSAQARENLQRHAEWTSLPNGLRVAALLWHPELREAAYEAGAAVVIWTISKGKKGFYVGIQRNRNYPELRLGIAALHLREAEAETRGINTAGKNLSYVGGGQPIPTWFLHDSSALILSGSRSWKLKEDEFTKLTPRETVMLTHQALSRISRDKVAQWATSP